MQGVQSPLRLALCHILDQAVIAFSNRSADKSTAEVRHILAASRVVVALIQDSPTKLR